MKLTREDFYKLDQLDRIEYRQRHKLIEETYPIFSISLTVIYIFIIFTFFIILFIMIAYSAFGVEFISPMLDGLDAYFLMVSLFIIIAILIDFVIIFRRFEYKRMLFEDYFYISKKHNHTVKGGKKRKLHTKK